MANIKLKGLLFEAEDFKARSKESGKIVHFKSKDSYQSALKAGTHEDPKVDPAMGARMDTDISDYSTDGEGKALYKGKPIADYTYDDATDEFTLNTKDGIEVFDTQEDMYKYLQKNSTSKGAGKPNDMFGGDYSKDRGGEMKLDEFQPIYDKLKSKFSKTESTKLTSMLKK